MRTYDWGEAEGAGNDGAWFNLWRAQPGLSLARLRGELEAYSANRKIGGDRGEGGRGGEQPDGHHDALGSGGRF